MQLRGERYVLVCMGENLRPFDGVGSVTGGYQLAMAGVSVATVAVGIAMIPALPPGGGLLVAAYAGLVAMVLSWHWLETDDEEEPDVDPVALGREDGQSGHQPAAD
jgi:hypothetical protein